jgi:hypothetical protein
MRGRAFCVFGEQFGGMIGKTEPLPDFIAGAG